MLALVTNNPSGVDTQTIDIKHQRPFIQGKNIMVWSMWNSTVFNPNQNDIDRVKDMVLKLDAFGRLQAGWDGYKADVPSPKAIHAAKMFIYDHAETILPFYFVAPGVNGEVMIEFKDQTKAAELFFNPDGSNELLLFDGTNLLLESSLEENPRALFDYFG